MIDILVGLAIGGAAGVATSAPFALRYVKQSLTSKADVVKSVLSLQQENLHDFAELTNVKVKCLGIEELVENGRENSYIVFEFNSLQRAFNQVGIGIVGAQAEWVRSNDKKKITNLELDERIFLLNKGTAKRVNIPISQEGNMELSSVQLNVYEGGVSKTHKVKLLVPSQIFSASDI